MFKTSLFLLLSLSAASLVAANPGAGFEKPVGIYTNWGAFDNISDNVELDEALAMRQLQELIRLRKLGVQIEYYENECGWYDFEGGYRQWSKKYWPEGPARWLKACKDAGIKPGLWISTNTLWGSRMSVLPAWKDSYSPTQKSMAMFEGGFLPDLVDSMQTLVDQGVEMFKFDFAQFHSRGTDINMPLAEAVEKNRSAFHKAMVAFRQRNPQVRMLAYNGFVDLALRPTLPELRKWPSEKYLGQLLDVFEGIYCGDPAAADVPTQNFWRSKDIYSDHQVRNWEWTGIPLDRIDNAGFMIGTTKTLYGRRKAGWKTMLLLSLARGGWANTYYGDLTLLSDDDARWFAKAQSVFLPLQAKRAISTFGAVPAAVKPYGFLAQQDGGALVAVINPQQSFAKVKLPVPGKGRLLFADSGFTPTVEEDGVTLGPEQMALVGIGSYAGDDYVMGRNEDAKIPVEIEPIPAEVVPGKNSATTTIASLPAGKDIRVLWQQFNAKGIPVRSVTVASRGGAGKVLSIVAEQEGRPVPMQINYNRSIWSGLSWAAAEIKSTELDPAKPLKFTFTSLEPNPVEIRAQVHAVKY